MSRLARSLTVALGAYDVASRTEIAVRGGREGWLDVPRR